MVASADVEAVAPTGSGEGHETRAAGPSVDMAFDTRMAACDSSGEAQPRSFEAIVRAHLVAENLNTFRAMSGNGRDTLYTRKTVPHKAVGGPRHSSTVPQSVVGRHETVPQQRGGCEEKHW